MDTIVANLWLAFQVLTRFGAAMDQAKWLPGCAPGHAQGQPHAKAVGGGFFCTIAADAAASLTPAADTTAIDAANVGAAATAAASAPAAPAAADATPPAAAIWVACAPTHPAFRHNCRRLAGLVVQSCWGGAAGGRQQASGVDAAAAGLQRPVGACAVR